MPGRTDGQPPLRFVFMGSDPIALPALDWLRGAFTDWEWSAIYTQPDRPHGRGMQLQANPIKQWAAGRGVPVRQPERCADDEVAWLQAAGVDLILVMAYGQLLPRALLAIPRCGVLNLHASLLPALRGASPIHTAVASGLPVTGVSLMRIVPRMDAGPVYDQQSFAIEADDTTPVVSHKLANACVPVLQRCIGGVVAGTIQPVDQDLALVSYCRMLTRDDGLADFSLAARAVYDRLRAFQPWPGCAFACDGVMLKVGSARVLACELVAELAAAVPGTLRVLDGRVVVRCGSDALELLAIQRPGGRMLPTPEFLRGFRFPDPCRIDCPPATPLVADQPFRRKAAG
jgi:methionyl-tRNA formyltransferase